MSAHPQRRAHYHTPWKRGAASLGLVLGVMFIGTVGMHHYERISYLDAFYFMSMIATAQGSNWAPVTTSGKVFASLMAFVSVGAVVAALGYLFGPFLGKLGRVGLEKIEEEADHLRKKS